MEEALDFFNELRKNNVAGRKISPAELVQWLTFMLKGGAQANHSLKDAAALAQVGLSSLSKDLEDQNRLRAALTSRLGVA
jgi:hypothetical protein